MVIYLIFPFHTTFYDTVLTLCMNIGEIFFPIVRTNSK